MRLLAVTVRNYRLHQDLRLELDPQRTLIGGPNESGKSTLAEAMHRALFLKGKGNTEAHRRMQSTVHPEKPQVELEFEAGGSRYTLVKNFKGSSGSTLLTQAGGASWQGDAAEEQLAGLLCASPQGRGLDQWAHLWIWQGRSSDDPLAQAEAERGALVQRLQSQGGCAVIQSALDSRVAGLFSQRHQEFFNANGSPRAASALGRALQAETEAREEERSAQAELDRLAQAILRHEEAMRTIAEAGQALAGLEADRGTLAERTARSQALATEAENRKRALDEARRELDARRLAEQKVTQMRERLATARAAQAPIRNRLAGLEEALQERRKAVGNAASSLALAESALSLARARQDLTQARQRLDGFQKEKQRLQDRADRVEKLQQQRQELHQELGGLPEIDTAGLEQLQKMESALVRAQAVLDGIATGIEVLESENPVLIDGQPLQPGDSRMLWEETEISVGGSRLRLRPGGGTGLAKARQQKEEAGRQLLETLARLGLENVTAAATALTRRQALQGEIKALDASLKALDANTLPQEQAALAQNLRSAQAELEHRQRALDALPEPSAPESETRPTVSQAESAHHEARSWRDQAARALQQAEKQRDEEMAAAQEAERSLTTQQAQLDFLIAHEGGDEARSAALQEAEERLAAATSAYTAVQQEWQRLRPDDLPGDQARFDRAWKGQEEKRSQAQEARIAAAALLQRDGSSDPAATFALAQARSRSATAARESAELQAQAVRRLNELFVREQQALSDQFTRPLAERVTGYLQRLFGPEVQARVSMQNSGFEKLTLSRGGQAEFPFESLSNGAREQVAAAFRLAVAEILAEDHDGCLPVVFDDAFAHSDPQRVRQLQAMLDLASARGLQIILLTCTPADYAALGAKELRLGS